ncbi:methyltransferase [Aureococcus anophagefferens]|nr:methyltransferase [Aureococcus anophagefferens]
MAALSEEGLSFDAWCASKGSLVGTAGSAAVLTPLAARELWDSLAGGEDWLDARRLRVIDATLARDVRRATAFQSLLRGRKDRAARRRRRRALNELAPFNPTPPSAVDVALDMLGVGAGDVLYDLGCGDGRLVVAAARWRAAVGVELDAKFADKARAAVDAAGAGDLATVICGDALAADLADATKIFVYLVPSGLRTIEPTLAAARDRGVAVVAYTFAVPGWTHDDKRTAGADAIPLYRYPGARSST